MDPAEELKITLNSHANSPFLFVGSGFSLRYLGLPTWENLLRMFCKGGSPFEYYKASSDNYLPKCASLISRDYSEYWWKSDECSELRSQYMAEVVSTSSPLKIAISDLVKRAAITTDPALVEELETLRSLNIEGIITTNWDLLLEQVFPDYKVYIGQRSIVNQTPQNIAEIYKIHGCCTEPNSLILTEDDYASFAEKQAYLAAKLITIFVEHPVVFIGYSISDRNILNLLESVLQGLGSSEVQKLQQNLIFVQRSRPDRPSGARDVVLVVDGVQLPVRHLVTDDYQSIYDALATSKIRVPARVLRLCKEKLMEIVSSKEPSEQLRLLNVDEITKKEDVEFVVGIGVAKQEFGERGYIGLKTRDLFKHLIFESSGLDAHQILDDVLPECDTGRNYLPVHVFLKAAGVNPDDSNSTVKRISRIKAEELGYKQYKATALRATSGKSFSEIVADLPPEKVAYFAPHMDVKSIPIDELRAFCQVHFEDGFSGASTSTFRKLFCLYDILKNSS